MVAPPKARTRRRLILSLLGGILTLLCLGGAGVFISFYNEATKIDRSAPEVAVEEFLRAFLVSRDDDRALLFQCGTGGDFSQIAAYRADVVSREAKYSVGIRISWTSFEIDTDGKRASVRTDLIKTVSDGSGRQGNPWEFQVVDNSGWRVCGAIPLQ